MAKLTAMQKEQFNDAKKWFGELEMRIFFSRELRMMIGIMPDGGDSKNPLIYRMYVALCHPNDEFKKKIGLVELFNNFKEGRTTRMRITNMDDFANRMFDYMEFEEMELN